MGMLLKSSHSIHTASNSKFSLQKVAKMGGKVSTVHIASAYPGDIWVKVETERIKETATSSKSTMGASADISGLAHMNLGSAGVDLWKKKKSGYSAEYHELMEAGFTKMDPGKVTPYSPPQDHKDKDQRRSYVTIKSIDAYFEMDTITERLPCGES